MKRNFVLFVCTILMCIGAGNLLAIDCKDLPQRPFPARAVNDFAHMIDPAKAAQLEKQLCDYWNTTSLAVVVVTVENMNGNEQFQYSLDLANCWGIGDKATNRGILLFISKDEHAISIRTGKGIEFLITDAQSGRVTDDVMVPLFKSKKFSDGIDAGVQKLIEILGTMSWGDRMQAIAQKKAFEEKQTRENWEKFFNILLFLGALALIVFLFFLARRASIKNAMKNKVRDLNKKICTEILAAYDLLAKSKKAYEKAPFWAQKERNEHEAQTVKTLESAGKLVTYSEKDLDSDIEEAIAKSNEAETLIANAFTGFQKIDSGLWQKIKTFAEAVPVKLNTAHHSIELALTTFAENKSFNFGSYHQELDNLIHILEKHKLVETDANQSKEVCEGADLITQKANTIAETMKRVVATKQATDNGIKTIREAAQQLRNRMSDASSTLLGIKEKYPPSVWQTLQAQFSKLTPVLDVNIINAALNEITRLNDFNVQDFAHASDQYLELQKNLSFVDTTFSSISYVTKQQNEAQGLYKKVHDTAASKVSEALAIIKNSDVESKAKDLAKKASVGLKEIELEVASGHLIDWVAINAQVSTTLSSALNSITEAKRNINDADTERARVARAAKVAKEAKSRQNSTTFSTFTPSSSGSLSDSGFGGYGGGGFGGGGSDTTW